MTFSLTFWGTNTKTILRKSSKMIYEVNDASLTEKIGFSLAEELDKRNIKRAFIALTGEVGVGKTVFTRGFASYFGISGVKSPTYTIVNEYSAGRKKIYHFDLYRIADSDDLESIGFHDYIASDAYSLLEWSERIPDEIPEDAIYVNISRVDGYEEKRTIEIKGLDQ